MLSRALTTSAPPVSLPKALVSHFPPHNIIKINMPSLGDIDGSGSANPARLLSWHAKTGDRINPDDPLCDIEVVLTEENGFTSDGILGSSYGKVGDGIIFTLECEDAGILGPVQPAADAGCPNDGVISAGAVIAELWQTKKEAVASDIHEEEAEAAYAKDREEEEEYRQGLRDNVSVPNNPKS